MRKCGANPLTDGALGHELLPVTAAELLAAARWRQARDVFAAVVDLPASERQDQLDELCHDDPDLRSEVASLLAHDRPSGDTVDRVLADAAAEVAGWRPEHTDEFPRTIGRYRILEKLGEGGMGEVFLAEDTNLGRRVALKLPPVYLSGDPRVRQQLQQEAHAAATINHPHVCVVHEVGDGPDGRPFIAMELIEGETLAVRIQRGPLPAAEVLALGRQAAGALSAAHALGIVHRDLKPSNIMLTGHGIKLLDFGLAGAARAAAFAGDGPPVSGFTGTVPYMSPEQVRSEAVDHRSDLFSLGVVLYEAATGQLPFDAPTQRATCEAILGREPTPPGQLVTDLPPALDRVIMRALAKPREARHQSATALGEDLAASVAEPAMAAATSPSSNRAGTRARWLVAALAAIVVATAVTYGLRSRPPVAVVPAPADVAILLADFTNATSDSTFDGTLRQALVVQLQQTPFLRVFPQEGVQETLRLMTRPPDTRLSDDVAQEITRRRGIKAWVSGSIAPASRGFAISLLATRGDSGELIARERVEAGDKVDVLPALGAAATRLRERLGESVQSIGQFNAPIDQATTASLDALKAYTLGGEQAARGDYAVAVALYERAVQIDPEFAMGYQALAREQKNGMYSRETVAASATRAYELRTRATEQERLGIEALYHVSVAGALERSIATAERWKAIYPLDSRPYHVLADLYLSLGEYANAVDAGRQAVRLNPDVAAAYSNLAGSLFALDRFDDARDVYRQAMARGLDAPEYHAFLWRIAYYTGDAEGMRRQSDWAAASSTWAFNMPALAAALQGRWEIARRSSEEAAAFFERRQMPGLVALAARYEALTGALVGDCATSRRSAARALGAAPPVEEQARVVLALALCGDTQRAGAFVDRLRRAYPEDTMLNTVWLPLIGATSALRRGHAADAVAALRVTAPYEGAVESWPIYVRGLALLQSGAGDEAQVEFQKIVDHPGRTFWFPLAPLARLGMARAKTVAGDPAGARRSYEALFASWKDADPGLPVLVDARKEYARLP
jgi:serine/threonine protein kinase/tetratricopeptide (TPR) repeat protein